MAEEILTEEGLRYTDIKVGEGEEAVAGRMVTVHYSGSLLSNGKEFDSSRKRGEPFVFHLGAGRVIRGWDLGVASMRVGGIRRLVIPAALGYGARAIGPIPANSSLVFEVELLSVD